MDRAECEAKLVALVREAWEVYKEYHPEGEILSMSAFNGDVSVFNRHYDEDANYPISAWKQYEEFEPRKEAEQ